MIIMAELLSIIKSNCGCCQAVTVTTVSVKLWKIFQNLWRVGNNRFVSNLWSQLHKTDHVRSPKEICARVLAQRHLCDSVCVCVNVGTWERERLWSCVLGWRLLCSAFQNTTFPMNSIGLMWIQKCEQAPQKTLWATDLRMSGTKPTESFNTKLRVNLKG